MTTTTRTPPPSASNGAATARADQAEILRALRAVMQPGQVTELRAIEATFAKRDRPAIISGYYSDWEKLAKDAVSITAEGVYFVPNEINPALLARAMNTCRVVGKHPTTSDKDITRRLWLLVDCDAVRPAGISASDEEHAAALARSLDITADRVAAGWPAPIVADSGNGGHLLWRIDEPADDGKLIERCLSALSAKWTDAEVKVDQTVHNPARIWKLYGSVAGKGDPGAAALGRPQRLSRLVECPATLGIVTHEQLEKLAGAGPQPEQPQQHDRREYNGPAFDLPAFVERHLPDARGPNPWEGGPTMYVLPTCPWDSSHTNDAAFVGQRTSGALVAGCRHDSCRGRKWQDLRELFDPRDQRTRQTASKPRWDESEAWGSDHDCEPEPPTASGKNAGTDSRNGQAATPKPEPVEAERFLSISSAELADSTDEQEWFIDGFIPVGQGGVFSGIGKSLKTTVAIDAGISIATGLPFLGKFPIGNTCRVGIMSKESGKATLRESGLRVAKAKGIHLREVGGLVWCMDCPAIVDPTQLVDLRQFILNDELGLVFLDPSYYALSGVGDGGSNLYRMAQLLFRVTDIVNETGCTVCLVHHNRKNRGRDQKQYDPPQISDMTQSGLFEWHRFAVMLGPRQDWDENEGRHWLWLRSGASAGGGSLWHLNVYEGRREHGGRVWDVALESTSAAKASRNADQELRDAEKKERLEDQQRQKLVEVMLRYPAGETKSVLKDESGLKPEPFSKALHTLRQQGRIDECEIKKNHRTEAAMRYISTPGARSVPVSTGQDCPDQ